MNVMRMPFKYGPLSTQRSHTEQWCVRGGFGATHFLHTDTTCDAKREGVKECTNM